MRVLLIQPKYNYPDPSPDMHSFGQAMPYLAGALRQAGHEVAGMNMNYVWCQGSAPLTLETMLREALEKHRPGLIGLGGLAPDYFFLRDALLFCRELAPDIPVVLGGGIVTYDRDFIFSHFHPDYAVVGEGDIAIVRLANALQKGLDLATVPSLAWWKDGQAAFNPVEHPANLDDLPLPDYEPFDFDGYLRINNKTNDFIGHTRQYPRIMPLSIGRSCPFQCTFCCHHKGAPYRCRSIDNVMREIAHFYRRYRYNILYVHDEVFSIEAEKAREFARKLKALKRELKADFDWGCYLTVRDVDEPLLAEMKESGCAFIGYGVESASNTVLKSMKKGTTAEQVLRAIRLTQQAGIGIAANFILGDVAETPQTIAETLDFHAEWCRDLGIYFYYITPYPGSALFEHCLRRGLITDRRTYYETVAHGKGTVNMTAMSDAEFRRLTEPLAGVVGAGVPAKVLSCVRIEPDDFDRGAPFEVRRSLYRIHVECPHCRSRPEYVYPLRATGRRPVPAFVHFCPRCHRKLGIDVSAHVGGEAQPDPNAAFYEQPPYTRFYPFDGRRYVAHSVATPHLLEAYKAHNIIRYGDRYYAVAQALGDFDLMQLEQSRLEEHQRRGAIFTADSVDGVKELVDGKDRGGQSPASPSPQGLRERLRRGLGLR